jgi:hypothetical protein
MNVKIKSLIMNYIDFLMHLFDRDIVSYNILLIFLIKSLKLMIKFKSIC